MAALERHNRRVYSALETGDLLEIQHGRVPHWAVYVGDEQVIHLSGQRATSVELDNFWDVVRGSKAYVNNNKDKFLKPFSSIRTKERALSTTGPVQCGIYSDNCGYFPSYGNHLQEHLKMKELILRWHNFNIYLDLQVGDLIIVHHSNNVCTHWAVYVGDGKVVHQTQNFLSSTNVQIQVDTLCTLVKRGRAELINDKDERFKPFPPLEVKERAMSKVTEDEYNLMTNNSEHFATWCRYGVKQSDQVDRILEDSMSHIPLPISSRAQLGEPVIINCGRSKMPGVCIGDNKAIPLTHIEDEIHWSLIKKLEQRTPKIRFSSGKICSTKLTMYCEHYASWCRYGTEQSDKFYAKQEAHDRGLSHEGRPRPLSGMF